MKTFKQHFNEKALTREQAIEKLKKTRKLTTSLLEPLGIGMESFLKLAQQEKGKIREITDKLIDMLSKTESIEWTDEFTGRLVETRMVREFVFKSDVDRKKFEKELKKMKIKHSVASKSSVSVDMDRIDVVADKGRVRKIAEDLGSTKTVDNMTGKKVSEALKPYTNLNDAAKTNKGLAKGKTEIWFYHNQDAVEGGFPRDAGLGSKWLKKQGKMPTGESMKDTHILLGKIAEKDLEKIFVMMQGEMWSPEGEARFLIKGKGLAHTSMSVGDIVKIGGKLLMVDSSGFIKLEKI